MELGVLCGRLRSYDADGDQVLWADEAVADPVSAGAEHRVAQRDCPQGLGNRPNLSDWELGVVCLQ